MLPFVVVAPLLYVGFAELAAVGVGWLRRRGQPPASLLVSGTVLLGALWVSTGFVVAVGGEGRMIVALADIPPACRAAWSAADHEWPHSAPIRAQGAAGDRGAIQAERVGRRIRITGVDERTVDLARLEPWEPPPNQSSGEGVGVGVAALGPGEHCVADPVARWLSHPALVIVDDAARPWPGGAVSRLTLRCGAHATRGLFLAAALTLVLATGVVAWRARWRGLGGPSDAACGRWSGTLAESGDGWVLVTHDGVLRLDLARARHLGGPPIAGPCRIVGRRGPVGEPYRDSDPVAVHRLTCGTPDAITRAIARDTERAAWVALVALMTLVAPLLVTVLRAYADLSSA